MDEREREKISKRNKVRKQLRKGKAENLRKKVWNVEKHMRKEEEKKRKEGHREKEDGKVIEKKRNNREEIE